MDERALGSGVLFRDLGQKPKRGEYYDRNAEELLSSAFFNDLIH